MTWSGRSAGIEQLGEGRARPGGPGGHPGAGRRSARARRRRGARRRAGPGPSARRRRGGTSAAPSRRGGRRRRRARTAPAPAPCPASRARPARRRGPPSCGPACAGTGGRARPGGRRAGRCARGRAGRPAGCGRATGSPARRRAREPVGGGVAQGVAAGDLDVDEAPPLAVAVAVSVGARVGRRDLAPEPDPTVDGPGLVGVAVGGHHHVDDGLECGVEQGVGHPPDAVGIGRHVRGGARGRAVRERHGPAR